MVDPGSLSAVVTSLKAAAEIAKVLRDASDSLAKAEGKHKLAELVSALADAKLEMANVQDSILEKDRRIRELEATLALRGEMVFEKSIYWRNTATGRIGPFCPQCFDSEGKVINLQAAEHGMFWCFTCDSRFKGPNYVPPSPL